MELVDCQWSADEKISGCPCRVFAAADSPEQKGSNRKHLMKKTCCFLFPLLLLLFLFIPGALVLGETVRSGPASPVASGADYLTGPGTPAPGASAVPPDAGEAAGSAAAVTPAAAFPRVIDRITDPAAFPDFSFDGEADLLDIWFPAIRDQDCTIFRYQDQIWLLDCGDERAEVEIVPLMHDLGITQVDRLVNTHPHHDHLNGMYAIDAAIPIRELTIGFPEDATQHMTAAMEYCKGNNIPVSTFMDESVLGMGDGFVTFVAWMKSSELDTMNNRSAQFMVTYGDCSMLFMADLEYQGQKQLLEAMEPEDLKADLLRYPHHGKSKMIKELFEAIDPALSIITNTNKIVELRESTQFLAYEHAAVVYTQNPTRIIHLQTDGRHWLCELLPYTTQPADPV